MKHAKLLDCTLRDGAYLVDKFFGDTTIHGIIKGLVEANIDVIEIGFLQDKGQGDGKTVFKNAKQAKKYIPESKNGSLFSVLADYSRYSIKNLEENTQESFDAVEACFFKKERYDVIDFMREIKNKGYKVFVQPVDILGYSDMEIIELIQAVNEIEPYCFSIVDTFGSMYVDDLQRVYSLIHHNLISTARIGFHSHNNLQMSNALSQQFLSMTYGQREVVVDTTISGMGRGAGNTPTELVAQYMVTKLGYNYDIDAILDLIDEYMDNIRSRCTWGYTTPYFIAGCYSAHVNNIAYLTQKNSIRSRDIRYILNKIGENPRKRYDYELLEETYMSYTESNIDDSIDLKKLCGEINGKSVLIIAPGKTANETQKISAYIKEHNPIVITINFIHPDIKSDYLYFSNIKRYRYWKNDAKFESERKILTSNVKTESNEREYIISFSRLIKCGWENLDNSTIMLLRLLDYAKPAEIGIAGFDGYDNVSSNVKNYINCEMELSNVKQKSDFVNQDITKMLEDYKECRKNATHIVFVTKSRFSKIFE